MRWRDRSRVTWLREGEQNTSFFHRYATVRLEKKVITGLIDDGGVIRTDRDGVAETVTDYYSTLFQAQGSANADHIFRGVDKVITGEMNESLMRDFTEEEVKEALFQMPANKTPGPDGMSASFFQKYWHIVGPELTNFCLAALSGNVDLSTINHTYITLIPKISDPQFISQFCPISLCNIVFKLLSTVIINRLKHVLHLCIDEAQSAFVPGRLITDNALVAYELFHTMNGRLTGKEGFFALKLDMSKAYDRVEWSFLEGMLLSLGFHGDWVNLMLSCVKSVSYSIMLNGTLTNTVMPSRGLRQGDPLSPYLFLICTEGFSVLLRQAQRNGQLQGVRASANGPCVTHLFFADDSLIFGRATQQTALTVKTILECYEKASGQKVNLDKSMIFFSKNTRSDRKSDVLNVLDVQTTAAPEKYLGLPILIGRNKNSAFVYMINRLHARLKKWKHRFLSLAGREVLIKAVLQSLPTYLMSCFLLPKGLCRKIDAILSRFWWSNGKFGKCIFWKAWRKMCRAKQYGGMGFRDMETFNKALLSKQVWRLMLQPNSLLGRVLRARYYPRGTVLSAGPGHNASYSWKSIWEMGKIVERGVVWRVGDGRSIDIWTEGWLQGKDSTRVATPRPPGCEVNRVNELITTDPDGGRHWDDNLLRELFNEDDHDRIWAVPLGMYETNDSQYWKHTTDGLYTVRSCYNMLKQEEIQEVEEGEITNEHQQFFKTLWKIRVPEKIRIHIWRVFHNIIATRSNLRRKTLLQSSQCLRCGEGDETASHVCYSCPFARAVWEQVGVVLHSYRGRNIQTWCAANMINQGMERLQTILVTLWQLWQSRNDVVFRNRYDTVQARVRGIMQQVHELRTLQSMGGGVSEHRSDRIHWIAPRTGFLKINFDGGVNFSDRRGGMRCVVRDDGGNVVAACSATVRGITDPKLVEAMACRLALKKVLDWGIERVIVEGDALSVVNQLRESNEDRTSVGLILSDCRRILQQCPYVELLFTPREGNGVAHALAQRGCYNVDLEDTVWMNEEPACISDAAAFDRTFL